MEEHTVQNVILPSVKSCLFCKEPIALEHGLRKYCPEKFGKIDYCKYQQKGLNKKLIGPNVATILPEEPPEKPPPPPESTAVSRQVVEAPIIASVVHTDPPAVINAPVADIKVLTPGGKSSNEEIITKLMGSLIERQLTFEEIEASGLDIEKYDKRTRLPHCDLHMIEIGNYGLLWTKKETILIAHLNELLWI